MALARDGVAGGAGPAPVTVEEARLARAAAAGDGAAFSELYDRYERKIFNFCARICGSAVTITSTPICTCPPTRSVIIGAPPR